MNQKLIDFLFIVILLSMPFKLVNHYLWLPGFISGPFTHDFVVWPLLIGLLYTGYCQWKYKNVLYGWSRFKKYIIAYGVVLFASLAYGLFVYPYWDMYTQGQAMNNVKFAFVAALLGKLGVHVSGDSFLPLWVAIRSAKNIVLNMVYTVGGYT